MQRPTRVKAAFCYSVSVILKVKKVHPAAVVPAYAHEGDAGMDLFASEAASIAPGERVQVKTGIAVEFPAGYFGAIWDKSGLSHKHGLKTLGGVIDGGYRGEIMVGMVNLSNEPYTIAAGHKVAQMIIQKLERPTIEEVIELSDTVRGDGGFGSTGK